MSAQAQRHLLTPERRGMLAKVAIARKQLQLDDDGYREVMRRMTGHDSARVASDAQLHRVLGEFTRLGFKPSKPASSHSAKPNVRMISALWSELAPSLKNGSPDALRAFVQRQTKTPAHPDGVSAPEFLDGLQANKVIEGLKAWLKRVKKGEKE